jgi:hypothetical protein
MRRRRLLSRVILVVGLLGAGALWNATHTGSAPGAPTARRVARAVRRHLPAAPALQATGGPAAAVAVVPDPAAPHTQWALLPTPTAVGAWWFGVNTGHGWQWSAATPSTPLPATWPLPPRELLTRAAALVAGRPDAALTVPVPWNAVTGHVGAPLCWAARTVPGTPGMVTWMVVLPSTRTAHLVYEITSVWTAANVATGAHALTGLVAVPTRHPTRLCAP